MSVEMWWNTAENGTLPIRRGVAPEWKLPGGEPANKCHLLRAIAGLGVVRIPKELTRKEAEEWVNRGGRVFYRGYLKDSVDPDAVDVMPTWPIRRTADFDGIEDLLKEDPNEAMLSGYLWRNFGVDRPIERRGFYQEALPNGFFVTALRWGRRVYVNLRDSDDDGRVTTLAYEGNCLINKRPNDMEWEMDKMLQSVDVFGQLRRVERAVEGLLGKEVGAKGDFIFNYQEGDVLNLIQARPIRAVDEAEEMRQRVEIEEMIAGGVKVVQMEVADIGQFNRIVGERVGQGEPYILALRHGLFGGDRVGRSRCLQMDLGGCVGLMLPDELRRGMLEHQGYRFMANMEYRGLPIVIGR